MITIDPIKRPPKKSSTVDTTEIMKEVDQKFADLIDGAPDKLNTIKELAEAVANIPKIDNLATKEEIPTKISQIENDINLGSIPVVNHGTSDTTFELTSNIFHKWDTVSELTLTLAASDENIYNEYMFQFTSGDTATTLTVPSTIVWNRTPNIGANKTYQFSIVNNIGTFITV